MGRFVRYISDEFLSALKRSAEQPGWWQDVLRDKSLIIALRDNYLNVYWQGQSIFKVTYQEGQAAASTHPKYLLNPALSGQVALKGEHFSVENFERDMITRKYEPGVTLSKLKRAAGLHSGSEKEGVHAIAMANGAVVDVEIAMSVRELGMDKQIPRMDLAVLRADKSGINLMFWEAKTYVNPELKSKAVLGQITKYKRAIRAYKSDIVEAYRNVAKILVDVASMSGGVREVSQEVKAIASGSDLIVSEENVGLIVYGYDAHQKGSVEAMLKHPDFEEQQIRWKGDPRGLLL